MDAKKPRRLGVLCSLALSCGGVDESPDMQAGTEPSTGGVASTSSGEGDGSSTGTLAPAQYGAGTRLHPVVERAPDGSEVVVEWYDSELGFACEPRPTELGVRCTPTAPIGDHLRTNFQCTTLAYPSDGCFDVPEYATVKWDDECRGVAVFRRGEAVDQTFYLDQNGTCHPGSGPGFAFERVPEAMLAGGQWSAIDEREVTGAQITFDDGAFAHVASWFRDEPCFAWIDDDDGTGWCLGGRMQFNAFDLTASVACEPPYSLIVDRMDPWCDPPRFTAELRTHQARVITTLHEGPAFSETSNGCEQDETTQAIYDTRALEPDDAPELHIVHAGNGRIQRRMLADDEGQLLGIPATPPWYDAELDTVCEAIPTNAGLRCLPFHYNYLGTENFADAACSELVGLVADPDAGFAMRRDPCQGNTAEVFEVGEAFEGVRYVRDEDGACVASENRLSGYHLLPLAPTTFEPIERERIE